MIARSLYLVCSHKFVQKGSEYIMWIWKLSGEPNYISRESWSFLLMLLLRVRVRLLAASSAGVGFCHCLGTVCIELTRCRWEQVRDWLDIEFFAEHKGQSMQLGWPSPDPKPAFDLQAALVSHLAVCLNDHDSSSAGDSLNTRTGDSSCSKW